MKASTASFASVLFKWRMINNWTGRGEQHVRFSEYGGVLLRHPKQGGYAIHQRDEGLGLILLVLMHAAEQLGEETHFLQHRRVFLGVVFQQPYCHSQYELKKLTRCCLGYFSL